MIPQPRKSCKHCATVISKEVTLRFDQLRERAERHQSITSKIQFFKSSEYFKIQFEALKSNFEHFQVFRIFHIYKRTTIWSHKRISSFWGFGVLCLENSIFKSLNYSNLNSKSLKLFQFQKQRRTDDHLAVGLWTRSSKSLTSSISRSFLSIFPQNSVFKSFDLF